MGNPKLLPAGYTNKFERMSADEYNEGMDSLWTKTREEQRKLQREAQEAIMAGFLEHRAVAKQVRTQTSPVCLMYPEQTF